MLTVFATHHAAPALDLGFLLDEVMMTSKPLDWDAVLSSPVPLKVVASCLDTLQPVILERFRSAADLSTCLRASANVPEVRHLLCSRLQACLPSLASCLFNLSDTQAAAAMQRLMCLQQFCIVKILHRYGLRWRGKPSIFLCLMMRGLLSVTSLPSCPLVSRRGLRLVGAVVF